MGIDFKCYKHLDIDIKSKAKYYSSSTLIKTNIKAYTYDMRFMLNGIARHIDLNMFKRELNSILNEVHIVLKPVAFVGNFELRLFSETQFVLPTDLYLYPDRFSSIMYTFNGLLQDIIKDESEESEAMLYYV